MVTINDAQKDPSLLYGPQEDLWEVASPIGVELPGNLLLEAADDSQLFSEWKVHGVRCET